ncbi:MAG: T9SS type A sorting domain-containing protein [Salinivirgaceae bacterium]|nr:T9SS type A sorting domain-containing protein [Salinivirgaceae bacterium]
MKNLKLLCSWLLLSLAVISVKAQIAPDVNNYKVDGKYRLKSLYYTDTYGEKGITYFLYDKENRVYKSYWKLINNSKNSDNFYTYDENGNLLEKYREFSDGKTSIQDFEYNENNNLIKETFSRSDGISGTAEYEYNSENLVTQVDCKKFNGWLDGIISYEYQNNKKVSGIIENNNNQVGTIIFTYDENDNLTDEFWDYGSWSQTFTMEYELDTTLIYTSSNVFITNDRKCKIIKENYDYNNQISGLSEFIYDDEGKLIEKIFTRSDGLQTTTTFEYDDGGFLTKSLRNYLDGKTAEFTYKYTYDRKLVERYFTKSDGVSGSELYEYDVTGKLIKGYYENFDTWLTGTLTFIYNDYELETASYEANNYTADISFENDDFNNIVKIHWVFSFGETQTYDFEFDCIPNSNEEIINSLDKTINCYPNPFKDFINIKVTTECKHNQLIITNSMGKTIAKYANLPVGNNILTFDRSTKLGNSLEDGIYLVTIISNNRIESKKIMHLN